MKKALKEETKNQAYKLGMVIILTMIILTIATISLKEKANALQQECELQCLEFGKYCYEIKTDFYECKASNGEETIIKRT